ncbi:MAG: ABC transporter permease subunit [Alphaproteobacteria bacterium]|nr:ABC transporter permease subunit [Alphaproteobacteria bacterium]
MNHYIFRRLLLMIPTLFGIMLINFAVVQVVPGGPVEQMVAQLKDKQKGTNILDNNAGSGDVVNSKIDPSSIQSGGRYVGMDERMVEELKKFYGFDQPAWKRFLVMIKNYLSFNFGTSYSSGQPIIKMIIDRMPVSLSLGLWSTLIIYSIAIPLGIHKAKKKDQTFDHVSSLILILLSSLPSFLVAILLLVVLAGGRYLSIFPLSGLTSDNFASLSVGGKIVDYLWHLVLPITAGTIGGFTSLAILTKNSFLEELGKNYVMLARAIGLPERRVFYGQVFRNAMLLVLASLPATLITTLFTSNLMIEIIFSLNGLGLMGYEAAITRDYSVVFATLYIFTLMSLVLGLIGDICYSLVDPRINFESIDS